MNNLTDNIRIKDRSLSVIMPVEVDDHITEALRAELDWHISRQRVSEIVFDFKKTEIMDSSGIGLILGRHKKMKYMGGSIKIINTNPRMEKILKMSGISRIVTLTGGRA